MFIYKDTYSVLSKAITIVLVCLFVVNDIALAQNYSSSPSSSSTLAAQSSFNRITPFFEKHGLDFKNRTGLIYASGALKGLFIDQNFDEVNIRRVINKLNTQIFSDGSVKIDETIQKRTLIDQEYRYVVFNFTKGGKKIEALFLKGYDKLPPDKQAQLRKELGITDEEKHHLGCPGLECVWFINPNVQSPARPHLNAGSSQDKSKIMPSNPQAGPVATAFRFANTLLPVNRQLKENMNVMLTTSCIFGCEHCIALSLTKSGAADVPKEKLFKIFDQLKGIKTITLLGSGEPMCYGKGWGRGVVSQDFVDIVNYAADCVHEVQIVTNAALVPVDKDKARELFSPFRKNVRWIVSVDEQHKKENTKWAKKKHWKGKSLRKTVRIMEELAAEGSVKTGYNFAAIDGVYNKGLDKMIDYYGLREKWEQDREHFNIFEVVEQGGALKNKVKGASKVDPNEIKVGDIYPVGIDFCIDMFGCLVPMPVVGFMTPIEQAKSAKKSRLGDVNKKPLSELILEDFLAERILSDKENTEAQTIVVAFSRYLTGDIKGARAAVKKLTSSSTGMRIKLSNVLYKLFTYADDIDVKDFIITCFESEDFLCTQGENPPELKKVLDILSVAKKGRYRLLQSTDSIQTKLTRWIEIESVHCPIYEGTAGATFNYFLKNPADLCKREDGEEITNLSELPGDFFRNYTYFRYGTAYPMPYYSGYYPNQVQHSLFFKECKGKEDALAEYFANMPLYEAGLIVPVGVYHHEAKGRKITINTERGPYTALDESPSEAWYYIEDSGLFSLSKLLSGAAQNGSLENELRALGAVAAKIEKAGFKIHKAQIKIDVLKRTVTQIPLTKTGDGKWVVTMRQSLSDEPSLPQAKVQIWDWIKDAIPTGVDISRGLKGSFDKGYQEVNRPPQSSAADPAAPQESTDAKTPKGPKGSLPNYTGAGNTSIHVAIAKAGQMIAQGKGKEANQLLEELRADLIAVQRSDDIEEAVLTLADKWNDKMNMPHGDKLFSDDVPKALADVERLLQELNPPAGLAAEAALKELQDSMHEALKRYSNVGRGSGQHSQVSTELYNNLARAIVLASSGIYKLGPDEFTVSGEDAQDNVVIFGSKRGLDKIMSRFSPDAILFKAFSNDLGLPLGIGVLVVNKKHFTSNIPPPITGGGTVKEIHTDSETWKDAPEKYEPGTPNIIGAIALAKALHMTKLAKNAELFRSERRAYTMDDIFYTDDLEGLTGQELLEKLGTKLIGTRLKVPVIDGDEGYLEYVNLDNAATTPTFEPVWKAAELAMSLDPGAYPALVKEAKKITVDFFGADPDSDVIFTQNTTEGINVVADNLRAKDYGDIQPVIVSTFLEHNSNELPWRFIPGADHIRVGVNKDGFIDRKELKKLLEDYNGKKKYGRKRIVLVAMSGASNVLGTVNDIKGIAELTHRYKADGRSPELLVDAAQLAAHRRINIAEWGIDYLAFSGHKMYAPFGSGGIIARKGLLNSGIADKEDIAASNVVGIAALGKAMLLLKRIGMDVIESHESALTSYALEKMGRARDIKVYGLTKPKVYRWLKPKSVWHRIGVISFRMRHKEPFEIANMLSDCCAIGIRSGYMCAHLLLQRLSGESLMREASDFGLARISLGLYNTKDDIDRLLEALDPQTDHPLPSEKIRRIHSANLIFMIRDAAKAVYGFVERRATPYEITQVGDGLWSELFDDIASDKPSYVESRISFHYGSLSNIAYYFSGTNMDQIERLLRTILSGKIVKVTARRGPVSRDFCHLTCNGYRCRRDTRMDWIEEKVTGQSDAEANAYLTPDKDAIKEIEQIMGSQLRPKWSTQSIEPVWPTDAKIRAFGASSGNSLLIIAGNPSDIVGGDGKAWGHFNIDNLIGPFVEKGENVFTVQNLLTGEVFPSLTGSSILEKGLPVGLKPREIQFIKITAASATSNQVPHPPADDPAAVLESGDARIPKGSCAGAIITINASEKLRKGEFTKDEFQKARKRLGDPASDTTVYSELNGLIALEILEIEDDAAKPYNYRLTDNYRKAPPETKRKITVFLKTFPARLMDKQYEQRLKDAKIKVNYLLAESEAKRIHDENRDKYTPAISSVIPEKTILCHIITNSILSIKQRPILQDLENDMASSKYSEKIVQLKVKDLSNFVEELREVVERKTKEYRAEGYDVQFDVACPSTECVNAVLNSTLDIKALAFKPCKETEIAVMQVEGIILALRALNLDTKAGKIEALRRAFEFLAGKELPQKLSGITDINEFIKNALFTLPVTKVDYNNVERLNRLIRDNIESAA